MANKKGTTAVTKISAEAKRIRKKNPGIAWKTAIKRASKSYNSGQLGKSKPKKNRVYQSGGSDLKRDRERKAMRPGKRGSYTERRKNRSDMPGKLVGMQSSSYNEMVLRNLRSENERLKEAESMLIRMQNHVKHISNKSEKRAARSKIKDQKKLVRGIKSNIRMFRSFLK